MKDKTQPQKAEFRNEAQDSPKYDTIKLSVDWHATSYRVGRIIDNAGPEAPQRFSPEGFQRWVAKQRAQARQVVCCYEAGPGGFVLHRQLTALGVICHVVAPRKLDPDGRGVRTDKTDALHLVQDLDRYLRGNPKALRLVRVPTPEQEQRRQEGRLREQLKQDRLRHATQGRSLLLAQGYRENNQWWKARRWAVLEKKLPAWRLASLEAWRELILLLTDKLQALSRRIEAAAAPERPVGLGRLSEQLLEREVLDWERFSNRKQPGAFAGLVGSVSASGNYHRDGSLTKAGHRRLRAILVELAWRWVRYQPQCPLIQRWKEVLLNPRAHRARRKRAIIAVARALFVDRWRWRTGRATPEQLGWKMVCARRPAGA